MSAADEIFAAIADKVQRGHEIAGERVRDMVKDRISVPVEYVTGPRGGTIVIRSKPGEPPRMETETLHDGMVTETVAIGETIETAIYDPVPYGVTLNNQLNRPIFGEIEDEAPGIFREEIINQLNS